MQLRLFFIFSSIWALLGQTDAMPVFTDTVRLQEVVVTARQPELEQRSPTPVQQMNAAQLNRIAGFSAADALRSFGGVTLRDYGGIGGLKTVMVRSLGAQHTAIMINGMPLSDAASGQVDLGKISLNNLNAISLFIGQPPNILQPARYYSAASVLDIHTVMSSDVEKNRNTRLGLRTGSFGIINPFISSLQKITPTSEAQLQLNYTHAHGKYPFRNSFSGEEESRKNTDISALSGTLAWIYKPDDFRTLQINADYYNSQRGLPGAIILYNPFTGQRLWNEDYSFNVRYINKAPNKLQNLSLVRYSESFLRYYEPGYHSEQGELNSTYKQQEYYFSQALSHPTGEHLIMSLATDLQVNTLQANQPKFAEPVRYTWLTNFSVQYHRNRLNVQAGLLSTFTRDETRNSDTPSSRKAFSPTLALAYRITSSEPLLRVRILYKDIFRMPTFNDLYYTRVGNADLKPEYARQFNLGVMGAHYAGLIHISATADLFHNRIKDKIVAIPTQNLFVWSMQNLGKTDIRGFDLHLNTGITFRETKELNVSMNYTRQHAIDITDPASDHYRNQIPYIPRESFSFALHNRYDVISAGLSSTFNGHRFILSENTYQNMLPSWWQHDLYAQWQLQTKPAELTLKFEIHNLLNEQYEVIKSFPMPGRAYFMRLEAAF